MSKTFYSPYEYTDENLLINKVTHVTSLYPQTTSQVSGGVASGIFINYAPLSDDSFLQIEFAGQGSGQNGSGAEAGMYVYIRVDGVLLPDPYAGGDNTNFAYTTTANQNENIHKSLNADWYYNNISKGVSKRYEIYFRRYNAGTARIHRGYGIPIMTITEWKNSAGYPLDGVYSGQSGGFLS